MTKKRTQPGSVLLLRVEKAFADHGYSELSMLGLAKACDLTARALYHYFGNKEEAFRAAVLYRNDVALSKGFAAGKKLWAAGGDALDILAEIINIRYGDTRRIANASPHLVDLNAEVFKRCNDIVTAVALSFEAELARLIVELESADLLQFRTDVSAEQVAQALANGARGVNQRLPSMTPDALAGCYRDMCRFVLYGCAELPVVAEHADRKDVARKRKGEHH